MYQSMICHYFLASFIELSKIWIATCNNRIVFRSRLAHYFLVVLLGYSSVVVIRILFNKQLNLLIRQRYMIALVETSIAYFGCNAGASYTATEVGAVVEPVPNEVPMRVSWTGPTSICNDCSSSAQLHRFMLRQAGEISPDIQERIECACFRV